MNAVNAVNTVNTVNMVSTVSALSALSALSAFISVVSLIFVYFVYHNLQKKYSEFEKFISLGYDTNPDYHRFRIGRSTFTTFDFHAEPQGYLQIGRFLMNWGPTDHVGNFSKPFDPNNGGSKGPYVAVAMPTRQKGGENNIKVSVLQSSYLKLRADGCERPGVFLALGSKNDSEKIARITVNDLSNKTKEMKNVAYVDDKPVFVRRIGTCPGGGC